MLYDLLTSVVFFRSEAKCGIWTVWNGWNFEQQCWAGMWTEVLWGGFTTGIEVVLKKKKKSQF